MAFADNPVESLLAETLNATSVESCPPLLARALDWAVFPAGGRIRPSLCLAVAQACGGAGRASVAAAAALELLHCASLVHDDLPCFDNASERRGKPSVQSAFGERLAVLAGDALIVLSFETLTKQLCGQGELLGRLTEVIATGVGSRGGIAAGQAWECESSIDLTAYQRAKTGALFAAATRAGAVSAGCENTDAWAEVGFRLGEAYQVADDILDAVGDEEDVGKPVRQDALHDRPNAVHVCGLQGAAQRLRKLITQAIDNVPDCPGRSELQTRIRTESEKLLPKHVAALAA